MYALRTLFRSLFAQSLSNKPARQPSRSATPSTFRPKLEALEGRCVPSASGVSPWVSSPWGVQEFSVNQRTHGLLDGTTVVHDNGINASTVKAIDNGSGGVEIFVLSRGGVLWEGLETHQDHFSWRRVHPGVKAFDVVTDTTGAVQLVLITMHPNYLLQNTESTFGSWAGWSEPAGHNSVFDVAIGNDANGDVDLFATGLYNHQLLELQEAPGTGSPIGYWTLFAGGDYSYVSTFHPMGYALGVNATVWATHDTVDTFYEGFGGVWS
jgi:hypothetical protein